MRAAADRRLMFRTEGETEIDGVSGTDSKTDMGLVSSEEDTTKGVSRCEVQERLTDATEGSETDIGTGRSSI